MQHEDSKAIAEGEEGGAQKEMADSKPAAELAMDAVRQDDESVLRGSL